MDIKKIIADIDKIDFSKVAEEFNRDIEKWTWKNEGDFLVFLNELVHYIKENKKIDSEEFLYNDKEIPFTSKGEYDKYMESLIDKIYMYCNKYSLPVINNSIQKDIYFNELCLLFKYNEVLYKVERIFGQGTVDIISLYKGNNCDYFIDYNSIINDEPPLNYKEIIKTRLEEALKEFKESYSDELKVLDYDVIFKKGDN